MKYDNQNPIRRDDPRLTAYALDEGTPEERADVEAALAADASLAEEVESIRQTAALLETTLAAEPLPESKTPTTVPLPQKRRFPAPVLSAIAAAVCVCVLIVLSLPAMQGEGESARNDEIQNCEGRSNCKQSGPRDRIPNYSSSIRKMPSEQGESSSSPKDLTIGRYSLAKETREKTHDTLTRIESSHVSFDGKYPICYPDKDGWIAMQRKREAREAAGFLNAMNSVQESAIPCEDRRPVNFPEAWSDLTRSREGLGQLEVKDGPTLSIQQQASAGDQGRGVMRLELMELRRVELRAERQKACEEAKKLAAGRETHSLMMTVDPRIIIQEKEEERIGVTPAEVYTYKYDGLQLEGKGGRGPFHNAEDYLPIIENEFLKVGDEPLSTFSIDVDTAAYSNMRRFINGSALPPKNSVRIEELVNYFPYHYTPPTADDKTPFTAHLAIAECPWNKKHQLVRVALKGKEVKKEERPAMNLVFLLDVSGSMSSSNKLPLVKTGMKKLVEQLDERDHIGIVTYAGNSGIALPSTAVDEKGKAKILAAIDQLHAGGSTNGASGIQLAYQTAAENFKTEGCVNRVILCTDGDFNVGTTNNNELVKLIEKKAKGKIFLTVLGFGCGNLKDGRLETLADKGNGNYGYVDTEDEAEKILVRQQLGTLVTIAKDVKIQVEFNPRKVKGYRLLGYENRVMAKEDFNDDTKDAGEIGAGHTITAFYELIPAGSDEKVGPPAVDPLKYQPKPGSKAEESPKKGPEEATNFGNEILTLKLRYKQPDGDTSTKVEFPLVTPKETPRFDQTDDDFRFAGSVVGFAMLLRDSKFKGTATYAAMLDWAEGAQAHDPHGYRREFIQLMRKAESLSSK